MIDESTYPFARNFSTPHNRHTHNLEYVSYLHVSYIHCRQWANGGVCCAASLVCSLHATSGFLFPKSRSWSSTREGEKNNETCRPTTPAGRNKAGVHATSSDAKYGHIHTCPALADATQQLRWRRGAIRRESGSGAHIRIHRTDVLNVVTNKYLTEILPFPAALQCFTRNHWNMKQTHTHTRRGPRVGATADDLVRVAWLCWLLHVLAVWSKNDADRMKVDHDCKLNPT